MPTLQPAEIKGTGPNTRSPGMEIVRFARQNCGRIERLLIAIGGNVSLILSLALKSSGERKFAI